MLTPVTLLGKLVRLEPLTMRHADDLSETTYDPETWRYHGVGNLSARADLEKFIQSIQDETAQETGLNYAIVQQATNKAVGVTALWDISLPHKRAEIGRTWLSPAMRRTGINTEAKYLLFKHAFEDLGMIRVQLKTDTNNATSMRAIKRLGAVNEGVLRAHMILHTGLRRDTVYYSVLSDEWAAVKARLEALLAAYPASDK